MTPAELDAIEARAAAAESDAALLGTVCFDVPALCAALREAWREHDIARECVKIEVAQKRDLYTAADTRLAKLERVAEAARATSKAWDESWDCSYDPGHAMMVRPIGDLDAALAALEEP